MDNKPLVSIIMATYNRADLIVETLRSISAQSYSNWECIIIDDGGSDTTEEVIAATLKQDQRFKYLKRTSSHKKGLPGCRNYGLEIAQGDYIIFFDDDDIVHPLNLELCVQELQQEQYQYCRYHREVFAGSFDYTFDMSREYDFFEITEKELYRIINSSLPFNSCAVMWRASCYAESRFKEDLMYAEEWELYVRMISQGLKGVSITKTLFFGRKHPKSNTGEFAKKDPIRVQSKIKAAHYMISHLEKVKRMSREIGMYMFSIGLRTDDKTIAKAVLASKNLAFKDRCYLTVRYHLLPISIPLGKMLATSKKEDSL